MPSASPLSFAQVGLGPLGLAVCREALRSGWGPPAGAVDPAFAGRPLAELVEGYDGPLAVAGEVEELPAGIDCAFVTTVSDLARCAPTVRSLLALGVDVVSSCEELAWPWLRHPELAETLDADARAHSARVLGTGVNPGFLMDALPLFLSTLSTEVRSIEVGRVQDAATRRVPFQRKIGAGMTHDAFAAARDAGTLRHVGLGESLHFLAAGLGIALDRWDEELTPVLAPTDTQCAIGPIAAGDPAGVRQVARGWEGDTLRAELVFQASIDQPDPRDWVHLEADPPIDVVIPGAVHGDSATIAVLLNAARALSAAPPGLHTMATVAGLGRR